MAENVVMPQLGESIAEGTIVKWLKAVGEAVKKDEDLLVISTDKVEAEIPAPADGVRHIDGPAAEPIDVANLAGAAVAKRAVPAVLAVIVLVLILRRLW